MNKAVYHALVITALFKPILISCTPLLVLKLSPKTDSTDYNRVVKKLEKKDKIASYESIAKGPKLTASGIFATYAGFLGMSDFDGKIIFPLKHSKPIVTVVVTNRIIPILLAGNTIDHWETPIGTNASFYTIERKHDADTDQLFWMTTESNCPMDKRIPPEAVIIIAKPYNIDVPTGITLTTEGPHFFLPTLYAKKGVELIKNSLYMLSLSHFFRPIQINHLLSPALHIENIVD